MARSLPESGSRFTDDGTTHAKRGLKLRPVTEIRTVPIPPILVGILREHIEEFGTAPDGRIFQTERGGIVGSTAYGDVWAQTRALVFTPAQVASPLARRPYDLRHEGVSLWLNSGVPATEVAERAGHSVKVLLQIYAKCVQGQTRERTRGSTMRSTTEATDAVGALGFRRGPFDSPGPTCEDTPGRIPRIFRDHRQTTASRCCQRHICDQEAEQPQTRIHAGQGPF